MIEYFADDIGVENFAAGIYIVQGDKLIWALLMSWKKMVELGQLQ